MNIDQLPGILTLIGGVLTVYGLIQISIGWKSKGNENKANHYHDADNHNI